MKKFIFIFVAFVFLCSCEKDRKVKYQLDNTGVVIAAPYLWKTSLHQKEPASNSFLKYPIIYNDNILVPTTKGEDSRLLSLINTIDGSVLWRWNDLFRESEYIDIDYYHQYSNLVTYQYGGRSYCINMDNGETYWKLRRNGSFDIRITSWGQYYFSQLVVMNEGKTGYNAESTYKGDILTGEISEFVTPNYTLRGIDCIRRIVFANPVPNQENLLLVSYYEAPPDWIMQSYFGLYDTVSGVWLWERIETTPPQQSNNVWHQPQIVNNKIYAAVCCSIVCHDLSTGKQLWKRNFSNDFMFSGFIIEDGRLIANNEDCFTVCLNLENGSEQWRVKTAGTSGKMSYLNGIVYFVGGSVPRLFGIEASTGKIVWKIDAGLLDEGRGGKFRTNAVYVFPAKGNQPAKVIALSNMYAYCFEAYR